MTAYYSENDPFAAAWLRELMKDGLIAQGWVDERSILDVRPCDIEGFTQCHFFAGIGIWSLALRVAGWPDDRPVWTGSAPCQPFSAAGKGGGFDDERHLWPAWFHLVQHGKRHDVPVLGEQVASKDGRTWFDLVSSDMEALDHACGAVDTSAAGLGAPFIGQRLYWLAATNRREKGSWEIRRPSDSAPDQIRQADQLGDVGGVRGLAASESIRCGNGDDIGTRGHGSDFKQFTGSLLVDRLAASAGTGSLPTAQRAIHSGEGGAGSRDGESQRPCDLGRLAASDSEDQGGWGIQRSGEGDSACGGAARERSEGLRASGISSLTAIEHSAGIPLHPTDYWRDADWLLCRDPNGARFRPVEPGSFPLVDARSLRNRLGTVRGAGNALNISQAACFVEAVMEHLDQ